MPRITKKQQRRLHKNMGVSRLKGTIAQDREQTSKEAETRKEPCETSAKGASA